MATTKPKKGGVKTVASKSQSSKANSRSDVGSGKIRIIGGQWRGRKLSVPEVPGLRPTPDRQRETLFNWLMPVLSGARCLDLFAGSGVLGLEAASRGAAEVVLVEQHPLALRHLRDSLAQLHASQVSIHACDARHYLQTLPPRGFDIVFLDPPFALNLLPTTCQTLSQPGWLNAKAMLYLEMPRVDADSESLTLPAGWQVIRRHLSRDTGAWLVQS